MRQLRGGTRSWSNSYVGPQAVAEGVFQRLVTDIAGFTAHPQGYVDGGDTVVVEGRYRGRMKATAAGS